MGAAVFVVFSHRGRDFDGLVSVLGICFGIAGAIPPMEYLLRIKYTWEP